MKIHTLILGNLQTNCYIIADKMSNEAIIVDAPDNADKIINFVNENNYKVKKIILTHGHFDHMLALSSLKEKLNVPVVTHKNSMIFLSNVEYNLCHHMGIEWKSISADVYVNDGDIITLGENSFRVIHTPGHTSDSICLYSEGILISGDTLFYNSIGRSDFPTGSLNEEIDSINNKLLPLPDSTIVYPGHGESTTIGLERKENPYLK